MRTTRIHDLPAAKILMSVALAMPVVLLPACATTPEGTGMTSAVTRGSDKESAEYASLLFDDSRVHEINVEMADGDWKDLLGNPSAKTKYEANVTIDGETVDKVSFATKGNSSLSSVASNDDSDRYGFKINFGKFVDGQTYHGLDKLNLSNMYSDATYMKDYISYEIFRQAGVDAPLTSYVWLKVNDEPVGLYLAIEEVGDSYLDRTQDGQGELYKPENYEMGGKGDQNGALGKEPKGDQNAENSGKDDKDEKDDSQGKAEDAANKTDATDKADPEEGANKGDTTNGKSRPNKGMPEGFTMPEGMEMPEGMKMPSDMGDAAQPGMPGGLGGPMGFGGKDNGGNLTYVDDNLDSYSVIFDNDETDADEEANKRVVAALKALSEGKPEEALDTDALIAYFVAHNFVLNYDSYTGTMTHNYYLYERDGKLTMLPWDYNLAFGGFGKGDGAGGGKPDMFGMFGGKVPRDGQMPENAPEEGEGNASDEQGEETSSKQSSDNDGKDAAVTQDGSDEKAEASADAREPKRPERPEMNPEDAPESSETPEDVSELVNMGIDTPLSIPNGSESTRPMWQWIQDSDEYTKQYHNKYDELLSRYFESGEFEKQIDEVYDMIRPYVEKDPTAFYTVDEFDQAYETLRSLCQLRAKSIRAQLDGKLATKTDEQDEDDRIDTESITVSAMGRPRRNSKSGKKNDPSKTDNTDANNPKEKTADASDAETPNQSSDEDSDKNE